MPTDAAARSNEAASRWREVWRFLRRVEAALAEAHDDAHGRRIAALEAEIDALHRSLAARREPAEVERHGDAGPPAETSPLPLATSRATARLPRS